MAYYLYNGVRLPDIYAAGPSAPCYRIIVKNNGVYGMVCCAKPIIYKAESGLLYGNPILGSAYFAYRFHETGGWLSAGSDTAFKDKKADEYIWTSHDILYEDSTDIFLAASEPVPAPKKGRLTCSTMDFSSPTIKRGDTWVPKKWNMPEGMNYPSGIWTDGTNIYHSVFLNGLPNKGQLVLNGDTWESKAWKGLTEFPSAYIWTDGVNIYYSYNDSFGVGPVGNYVLNGDTWEPKTWNNEPRSWDASDLWTDGTNIYYSGTWGNYVLNGDTWEPKTWGGDINIDSVYIWSDGTNIYHSKIGSHYVLNGDTWERKTFANSPETYFDGQNIWTDGVNVYYRTGDECYVLNGDTWEPKVWKGANAGGSGVWTDGTNIYSGNYVLTTSAPPEPPDPEALLQGHLVGCRLRAMRRKPTEPDTPVEPDVPIAALRSADGYTLKDSNGLYITAKEAF